MPRGLLHSAMTGAVIAFGKHKFRFWSRTPVILTDVFMVFYLPPLQENYGTEIWPKDDGFLHHQSLCHWTLYSLSKR